MAERLDDLVAKLLQESGTPAEPPIDLHDLAMRIGVDEVLTAELVEDGRLEHSPSHTRIMLNGSVSEPRRRFTFAHELAHLLLVHPDEHAIARRTFPNINDEERFCDRFAAALLMPAAWIEQRYGGRRVSMATLRQIADEAEVSLSAAAVRANTLLGWSRALLRWRGSDSGWRLASSAGVPHHLHGCLNSAPGTPDVLNRLGAGEDSETSLPLLVRRQPQAVRAEVSISRYRRTALALIDLRGL